MDELRILTFNIRYDEPSDGPNRWQYRFPIAARLIARLAPDVIGMQEPERDQLADLDRALPGYGRFGVSRYGNDFEKFAPVYYRRETITVESTGVFWVSPTPDVPASMDWALHKPYAVNHGVLRHRSGLRFALFNTHFPYKPEQQEARRQAAGLLIERAAQSGLPVVITGDFNSPAGGEIHRQLTAAFADAWLQAEVREGPADTMHRFTGQPFPGSRIDWILTRGLDSVRRADCITAHEDGRYPSDHFPVMATLVLPVD